MTAQGRDGRKAGFRLQTGRVRAKQVEAEANALPTRTRVGLTDAALSMSRVEFGLLALDHAREREMLAMFAASIGAR